VGNMESALAKLSEIRTLIKEDFKWLNSLEKCVKEHRLKTISVDI
jgi:hypothetical protein